MNLESLYYFTEVTKDLNITKTAQRLYLSQQTLSNHIKRLEDYYEMPLFYRKPRLSLTYAGEYVLRFAEETLKQEKNLMDVLADIRKDTSGLIRFGSSTLRSSASLPSVLEKLSRQYPQVEIRIVTENSLELENMVLNGDLDLAITLLRDDDTFHADLEYIPLMEDPVYLCVTDSLLKKYYGAKADVIREKSFMGADVADFSEIPFCILNNRIGNNIARCFSDAKITPKVYSTNSNIQITTSFGTRGLAATFATKVSLYEKNGEFCPDLNIFPLLYQGKPFIQRTCLIKRKDRYVSSYLEDFMLYLKDFFRELEELKIEELY